LQARWKIVSPLVRPATLARVKINDDLPNGPHLQINEAIELGAGDTKVATSCAQTTLSASESRFAHIDRQLGNLHADALCHRPAMSCHLFGTVRHFVLPRYQLVWVASVRR
jgi:hypothetical protein